MASFSLERPVRGVRGRGPAPRGRRWGRGLRCRSRGRHLLLVGLGFWGVGGRRLERGGVGSVPVAVVGVVVAVGRQVGVVRRARAPSRRCRPAMTAPPTAARQVEDEAVADERQAGGQDDRASTTATGRWARGRRPSGDVLRLGDARPRRPRPRRTCGARVVEVGDDRDLVEVVLRHRATGSSTRGCGRPTDRDPERAGRCRSGLERTMLMRNTSSTDRAMMKAPMVITQVPEVEAVAGPVRSGRRRLMPCRPTMCIGPKVRFMPTMVSQKCHLPSLVEHVAEDLRPPEVEAAEEAEEDAAEDHVVEVGDDVVGVGLLGVGRGHGVGDAGEAADGEHRAPGRRRTASAW